MIQGGEIEQLVTNLKRRHILLAHACQYQDFASYLQLGGVPSRQLLEANVLPFTRFDSDARDKQNGVWDKVFANFSDFGETFAKGGGGTPNVFSPILLFIRPDALVQSFDIAITLRSAGEPWFNRVLESLESAAEAERLFLVPLRAESPREGITRICDLFHDNSRLKWRVDLEKEFPDCRIRTPELHCTIPGELLSSQHIE